MPGLNALFISFYLNPFLSLSLLFSFLICTLSLFLFSSSLPLYFFHYLHPSLFYCTPPFLSLSLSLQIHFLLLFSFSFYIFLYISLFFFHLLSQSLSLSSSIFFSFTSYSVFLFIPLSFSILQHYLSSLFPLFLSTPPLSLSLSSNPSLSFFTPSSFLLIMPSHSFCFTFPFSSTSFLPKSHTIFSLSQRICVCIAGSTPYKLSVYENPKGFMNSSLYIYIYIYTHTHTQLAGFISIIFAYYIKTSKERKKERKKEEVRGN